MALFKRKKKDQTITEVRQNEPKIITENYIFKAAGTSAYKKNIQNLADTNDDFSMSKKEIRENCMEDERIYKYTFNVRKVELVPEPDNPADPNAVKIVADYEHIGYVPASKCKRVKKLLESPELDSIFCDIYGGKYKILKNGDLDTDETEYGAEITIFYKKLVKESDEENK